MVFNMIRSIWVLALLCLVGAMGVGMGMSLVLVWCTGDGGGVYAGVRQLQRGNVYTCSWRRVPTTSSYISK